MLLLVMIIMGNAQVTAIDKVMVTASSGLIVADWWLTVDAINQGLREHGRRESNPLLPDYPSKGYLTAMVALGLGANLAVLKVKQPWLRRAIWGTVMVLEAKAIGVNIRAGYRFRF